MILRKSVLGSNTPTSWCPTLTILLTIKMTVLGDELVETNTIICGNCIDVMKQMPDNCIDLTITSPPYDNLRNYNSYTFDFNAIARELYRVTKQGGIVVWVIGGATVNGSESGTSFRQALYFKGIGFNLHDTMIYKKKTPPLTHKRYEQEFEYMFVFVKGKIKTFNPITVDKKYMDKRINKAFTRNKTNEHDLGFSSSKTTCIKGNVWEYLVGGGKSTKDKIAFQHPAIFPEQLAEDHIISWSNENDLIFDPMCGSGTTLKMAKLLNRKYIGIDISKEYCEIAQQRIDSL